MIAVSNSSNFYAILRGVEISWDGETTWNFPELEIDFTALNWRLPIIGRTGCGKSTLLYVLAAMKRQSAGAINWKLPGRPKAIIWNGTIASGADARAWHGARNECFSFAFQESALLPYLTVEENLLYPLLHAGLDLRSATTRVEQTLETVLVPQRESMKEMRCRFPRTLSGGQRQRFALAKAMAREPAVLFADEPTGSLDFETRAEVMQRVVDWLDAKPGQRAFVWVTHHRDDPATYGAPWALQVNHPGQEKPFIWQDVAASTPA